MNSLILNIWAGLHLSIVDPLEVELLSKTTWVAEKRAPLKPILSSAKAAKYSKKDG